MSPAHLGPALAALLQSLDYAAQLGRDPWDFALEISALRDLGLSNGDIRWLLCKGWVLHATETTRPDAGVRSFVPTGPLVLADRCCFVLTPVGESSVREGGAVLRPPHEAAECARPIPGRPAGDAVPQWDKDRRLLRFGDAVVKQFKVPAPNQEIVLVSFQEEGWSVRIDDPLPMVAALDPKRRLHDTINSLNRNQRRPLLRFFGDGSGQSVCWEPLAGAQAVG
jgi:hypothetical protein